MLQELSPGSEPYHRRKVNTDMKLFLRLLATMIVALAGAQTKSAQHSYSTHTPTRKYNYALVTMEGNVSKWGDMGSNTDALRDRTKVDTLYVRKDGVLYAITDRDTIAQTKSAIEPM